jgi:hypothetical protein
MKIICGFAMMSLLGWGQDAPPKTVQKLIPLKYVDAGRVQNLVSAFFSDNRLQMRADDHLHVISVSGRPEQVATLEEAIKKLDVPPVNFELTIYLISTSQAVDQLPDALASTAKQLHGVFAYKGYQLLDSFALRGRDGQRGSSNGTVSKDGKSSDYSFRYEQASVSGEAPRIVNLHQLYLNVRLRTGGVDKDGQPMYHDTGLSTDIDIRDGQKVVVGKSDVNNGESPLILVVTVKVVD